jgi:hypothetical protein
MSRPWLLALTLLASACRLDAAPTDGGGAVDFGSPPGPDGGTGGSGLPCDVDAVLQAHCQTCHNSPPRYGAPMPLLSYADVHAAAKSAPSMQVYQLMKLRLHSAASPMPPTNDLDAATLQILDAWLDTGAPAATGAGCGGPPPDDGGVVIGPGALPCTPTQTFTAHAAGSTDRFQVPVDADNLYECFTFKSPFDGTAQGTAWAPIIGDERVLHHWILYRTATAQPDGGVMNCQMPSDATFVAGWAPGGGNYVLPSDVGLEVGGPTDNYILQIHYHNVAKYPDALDASGVAFCTTETPRAHEAGIFTLGTVNINIPAGATGYDASGTCGSFLTQYLPQPVTIIATFPHMHGLGRKVSTVVHRGSNNGPAEVLVDVEHFSFDSQTFYQNDPPFIFNPGDSATTTCTYDNPGPQAVTFGERTEDEMCFDFVLLYPISIFQNNRQCGIL